LLKLPLASISLRLQTLGEMEARGSLSKNTILLYALKKMF
jgi:hypothetical protein